MQNIRLDAGAAALLARLHGAGYAAYAVGGCVRDGLLGRTRRTGTFAPVPGRSRCWHCSGRGSASPPGCSTAP